MSFGDYMKVRRVDEKAVIAEIEAERRRRHKIKAEIPKPKYRQLGEQDITDVPTNTPWQHLALNKLGQVYPVNADWICPQCGLRTISSFPPDICPICRYLSPIKRMNLRR